MRDFLRPILLGIVVGVVLAVCGAVFSAGGHNFVLMMVFFPWTMLIVGFVAQLAWWLPFVVLVLVQFPIYFVLPRLVGQGRRALWGTIGVLALVHLGGIVLCFAADRSDSWRALQW
jgi:hypothetical protein